MSYPRAPGVPGPQRVSTVDNFCWMGMCFPGGSVHYEDFAMLVTPAMSESTGYLPGEPPPGGGGGAGRLHDAEKGGPRAPRRRGAPGAGGRRSGAAAPAAEEATT
jgi:hypothetical protein